jgi:thiamine-phosphate pyrophosphorylase
MQLYAISDRRRTAQPLLGLVESWSRGGVDFIQLREKDLDASQLQALTCAVKAKIEPGRGPLLVNISTPGAADLALASGADGVHLAGKPGAGAAARVRQIFRRSGREAIISVPCHSLEDIETAVNEGVELMLFSPIFEKPSASVSQGLEGLRRACVAAQGIPVFALGGVNSSNAADCLAVGAAGIAGIRLFEGDDWRGLVRAS